MSIAYTSLLNFRELVSDLERHDNQRRRVYIAVRDWSDIEGPSRHDLVESTGMPINIICGRVRELLNDGILIKGPIKLQAVVDGKPREVETLKAVVFRAYEPKQYHPKQEAQLQLL